MCKYSFDKHAEDISVIGIFIWLGFWNLGTFPLPFLYAPLIEKREVYCRPPQVLVKLGLVEPGTIWRLKKALYGQRTSPRAWEEERDKKLTALTWDSDQGKVGLKQMDTTNVYG